MSQYTEVPGRPYLGNTDVWPIEDAATATGAKQQQQQQQQKQQQQQQSWHEQQQQQQWRRMFLPISLPAHSGVVQGQAQVTVEQRPSQAKRARTVSPSPPLHPASLWMTHWPGRGTPTGQPDFGTPMGEQVLQPPPVEAGMMRSYGTQSACSARHVATLETVAIFKPYMLSAKIHGCVTVTGCRHQPG